MSDLDKHCRLPPNQVLGILMMRKSSFYEEGFFILQHYRPLLLAWIMSQEYPANNGGIQFRIFFG